MSQGRRFVTRGGVGKARAYAAYCRELFEVTGHCGIRVELKGLSAYSAEKGRTVEDWLECDQKIDWLNRVDKWRSGERPPPLSLLNLWSEVPIRYALADRFYPIDPPDPIEPSLGEDLDEDDDPLSWPPLGYIAPGSIRQYRRIGTSGARAYANECKALFEAAGFAALEDERQRILQYFFEHGPNVHDWFTCWQKADWLHRVIGWRIKYDDPPTNLLNLWSEEIVVEARKTYTIDEAEDPISNEVDVVVEPSDDPEEWPSLARGVAPHLAEQEPFDSSDSDNDLQPPE